MIQLRRRDSMDRPSGNPFKDPKTGRVFPGHEATFDQRVNQIIVHRRANPNLYPATDDAAFNTVAVALELEKQICDGLKNDPRHCVDSNNATFQVQSPQNRCTCGSIESNPKYCATCGGNKIVGWVCKVCGKERGI